MSVTVAFNGGRHGAKTKVPPTLMSRVKPRTRCLPPPAPCQVKITAAVSGYRLCFRVGIKVGDESQFHLSLWRLSGLVQAREPWADWPNYKDDRRLLSHFRQRGQQVPLSRGRANPQRLPASVELVKLHAHSPAPLRRPGLVWTKRNLVLFARGAKCVRNHLGTFD